MVELEPDFILNGALSLQFNFVAMVFVSLYNLIKPYKVLLDPSSFFYSAGTPYLQGQTTAIPSGHLAAHSVDAVLVLCGPVPACLLSQPQTCGGV